MIDNHCMFCCMFDADTGFCSLPFRRWYTCLIDAINSSFDDGACSDDS